MSGPGPRGVIWEVTYACQLRCTHCYTESGRRPARALQKPQLLRLAQRLLSLRLDWLAITGGEPLLVPGLFDAAALLGVGGLVPTLYTNGLLVDSTNAAELGDLFESVRVSVDGATAAVHDAIRGRAGSFDGALAGLAALDQESRRRRARGLQRLPFGIDVTLVQSNFHQLEALCRDLAGRFGELSFLSLGAAVPSGLASRPGYAEHELLTPAQVELLRDPALRERLRPLLPQGCGLGVSDGFYLRMEPGGALSRATLEIEPDGAVRALVPFEGTVGNLLTDPIELLWDRAQERRRDPQLVQLGRVETLRDWAAVTRALDQRFAAPEEQQRLARRVDHRAA